MTVPSIESTSMTGPPDTSCTLRRRLVRIGLLLLIAAFVGIAAGVLAFASGANMPAAVLTGGNAAGGAIPLLLAVFRQ